MNTSAYYKSNPKAKRRRLKQQAAYNKTPRGLKIRIDANKLNSALGTYGNKDGKDASLTGPGKGKTENASTNRRRPRMKKRYA